MTIDKVAKPYALTLIESADEDGRLDEVVEDIQILKDALNNRDLELLFKSPIVNATRKWDIVKAIFGKELSDMTMRFLEIIIRKKREPFMLDIIAAAEKYILEKKDITKVIVVTATEVSDAILSEIKEKIKSLGGIKKHLEIETKVDESLLGGFTAEFDNKIIDASIAHKLKDLRRSFN